MADNLDSFDKDVQELSDEDLAAVSGGKKMYCPKGTIKDCAIRDGKYTCLCVPLYTTDTATSQ